MKRERGANYPNGKTKLALFEGLLSCRDFGCSYDDYAFDLEVLRRDIKSNNCFWYVDINGDMYVDQVSLANNNKRILITDDWFKMVNVTHNVFISYAKEDSNSAKKLYDELRAKGSEPWLDEENLLPGQHWEIEIEDQIFNSDYFVALLSSNSVSKRGYVQREIRLALEVLDRLPEKEIFIVPVRLDECEPSHKNLNKFQRVDLFPDWEKGMKKIMRALNLDDA